MAAALTDLLTEDVLAPPVATGLRTRLLPPSEWPRLAGTLLDPAWQGMNTATDRVLVVEDGGRIVACTSLLLVYHLEGTWVAPAYRRRVSVGRRLVRAMRQLFRAQHVPEAWMMAFGDETAALVQSMGTAQELGGRHFIVRVS